MSRIEIRGEQFTIGKVFSDEFAFTVPPYQRPYAWTTEEAGELFDDLLSFLDESNSPIDDLSPYFLGSIVLIKKDGPDSQIVDGQQRLLTLTILLSTLRAYLPPSEAAEITQVLYEPESKLRNLSARYRVTPKERDVEFFQTYIQHEDGPRKVQALNAATLTDSQRNMRDNAMQYMATLGRMKDTERVRLAQYILQRCLLVVVSTPDLESAYRIFSVLNDRGRDLTPADILKADIIGRVPAPQQIAYTNKWDDLEEELGREEFNNFLSHVRTLYRKRWKHDTVLREFRQYVIATVQDSQHLIDEVLLPLGAAYRIIKNEEYEHSNEQLARDVNTYLRWLNRMPETDWIPPAMLYLSRYSAEPERLVRFFTDLERLSAGLLIRRSPTNKRFDRYNQLLRAIDRSDSLGLPDSPLQLTPEDRKMVLDTLSGNFYLNYSRARQYVLLRLDAALSSGEAKYEYKTITVEHVLPQRPAAKSMWLQWYPSPELHDHWVHRLGNLVLLSRAKNMNAGNFEFEQKKRTYFASHGGIAPFALTTQVLQEQTWTPQVVERRQAELMQRLKDLWRL